MSLIVLNIQVCFLALYTTFAKTLANNCGSKFLEKYIKVGMKYLKEWRKSLLPLILLKLFWIRKFLIFLRAKIYKSFFFKDLAVVFRFLITSVVVFFLVLWLFFVVKTCNWLVKNICFCFQVPCRNFRISWFFFFFHTGNTKRK